MTEFEKSEIIGRERALKALKHISPKFRTHTQENIKARYDIDLTGKTVYIVECKDRDEDSTKYDEQGWILQKDKYDALMQINKNAIYLNTFKDGQYALWFLKDVIDEHTPTVMKECWHTTVKKDYKEEKPVYYLHLKDAKITGYMEELDTNKYMNELAKQIKRKIMNNDQISNN